jgi:hypothetical protein
MRRWVTLFTTPENGGKAFLIGLHRCQNFKVAQRTTNETKRDPVTRKITRKGNPVKHKLGDMVLVGCNVKGSDNGTPSDPKFALRTLWEHVILPAYNALTAVGSPADGATVVHQEDNVPPHQVGDFHQWLTAEFSKRGWRLELQAPQGPYTNVLDLQVFQPLTLYLNLILTIDYNLTLSLPVTITSTYHLYVDSNSTLCYKCFLQCQSSTLIFCRCSITRSQVMTEFET